MNPQFRIVNETTKQEIPFEMEYDRVYFNTRKGQSYLMKPVNVTIQSEYITDVPQTDERMYGKVQLGIERTF
jgi:hypothetical protein